MRSILLIIALVWACVPSFSQELNDTVKSADGDVITVYAELLGWNTNVLGIGKQAKVEVEFGEESWGWRGNDGRNLLVDENGKDIKFNSMVDAMNYMGKRGWKFEAAYVVTVANQNVIHWLMSKEIHEGEDAKDGIQQRRDTKKKKDKKEKPSNEGRKKKFHDDIYW